MHKKYQEQAEAHERMASEEMIRIKGAVRMAFLFGTLTAILLMFYQPSRPTRGHSSNYYVDEYGNLQAVPQGAHRADRAYDPLHNPALSQPRYDYGQYR